MQLKINDYNNFSSNLEDFSAPYTLKDGSKFYEARRDSLNSASAIVIDSKGYFYLAYKMPTTNSITYITNDGNCNKEVHKAIKVFAKTFKENPKVVFSNPTKVKNSSNSCNGIYGKSLSKNSSSARIASDDATNKEQVRLAASSIWTESIASNWNINEELTDVVGTAINEIITCSANFSLVPKPPLYGTRPGYVYFGLYALQVVYYNSGLQQNLTYRTCVVSTARNYRTAAELASLGI